MRKINKPSTHFSHSDVSYSEDETGFTCINCKIVSKQFPNDMTFNDKDTFKEHLEEHKQLNHSIPAHITNKLDNITIQQHER